jgi:hypothetical protein
MDRGGQTRRSGTDDQNICFNCIIRHNIIKIPVN